MIPLWLLVTWITIGCIGGLSDYLTGGTLPLKCGLWACTILVGLLISFVWLRLVSVRDLDPMP
jgi:LytS/YehU family sensor histidine kinase